MGTPMRGLATAIAVIAAISFTPPVVAEECKKEYFHPDDHRSEAALARPHRNFAKMAAEAAQGNPQQQRSLAISYETGYLVAPCPPKADFWYRKAASGGDELAAEWVRSADLRSRLASRPECAGPYCSSDDPEAAQTMSLVADPRGHFYAELTINGVTERGMIDTGATLVALSAATAAKMGISSSGAVVGAATTANGKVATLNKMVPRMKIGSIVLENVEVSVSENLGQPLIGMSVLKRLKMRAEKGQMTLTKQ